MGIRQMARGCRRRDARALRACVLLALLGAVAGRCGFAPGAASSSRPGLFASTAPPLADGEGATAEGGQKRRQRRRLLRLGRRLGRRRGEEDADVEAELRRSSKLGTMGITTEGLAAPPAAPRARLSFLPPRDLGVWGLRIGLARLAGFFVPAPTPPVSSPATPGPGARPPRVDRKRRARELRYDRTVVVEAEVGRVMQVLNDLPRYQDWAGKGVLKEVKMRHGGLPTPASEREVEYKVRTCAMRPQDGFPCAFLDARAGLDPSPRVPSLSAA
jgi:hypothetical protein